MKAATKRILCYILLCLFVLTTITASLTFGRYTSEKASDNDYKGDIEYILGDAIIINTIDDFFQAIENGYSNIQLGEELDNPLIISGGMSGVVSDLTIDLNGHEIQRNNREPILDVKDGINLTIIDTSAEKTGSLYNPVGSVLKVSGGTLTAAAGIFESGPRSGKRDASGARNPGSGLYDEYASGDGTAWDSQNGGSFTATNSAVLYEKNGAAYSSAGERQLPVIKPKTVAGSNNNTVNGNMYFDSGVGVNIGNGIITDDTYLYYTFESENMEFSTVANNGSADYYYEYYVKGEQADGTVDFGYATEQDEKTEGDESDARVLVTVYVYNNVKGSADGSADAEGSAPPKYAAINMASGNLYARAGYYYSYFGEEDTYCVDATGGYMAVTQGQFNAFGKGVGIKCAYDSEAEANEYLNISRGNFYSEAGDTIRVSGGKLEIGTAKIEKDARGSNVKVDWFANGSAINVSGGDVTVNNSLAISVIGSGCAGIRSDGAGAVTANKNCAITLTGDQNVGIYSGKPSGGTSQPVIQPVIIGSQSSGEVTANITLNGEHSYGIYSAGGDVNIAGGGGSATFTLSGTELQGIYSTGGNVNIANGTNGGEVTFTIDSDNEYTPGPDDPTASDAPYSRAIYSNGGNINIGTNGKTIATFNLDGSYLQGIHANGGEVNICTADVAETSATFTLGDQAEKGATNITGIATGTAATVNIGSNSSTFTLNAYGETMSGIFAQGGAVNLLGEATFKLDGSGMGGIYSVGGTVVLGAKIGAKSATFTLTGSSMRGISVSGETSSATFNGETTVNMSGGINNSYGIAASQGTLTFNNSVKITAQGASTAAYGIHATGAGSVVDIGGTTTITYSGMAENSNGIHNVGGTVAISATTTITFDGGATNSNGIYNGIDAEQGIEGGEIGLGYQLTESGIEAVESSTVEFTVDLSKATGSTGIYSAGGTINISGRKYTSTISESTGTDLDNASIYATAGTVNFAAAGTAPDDGVTLTSDCLGIVIRGTLNFNSGNVDITTLNGTAIYVYQGNLTAAKSVTVDITSGINGKGWGVGAESQTNIYNGVFVNGGSLIASGTFNVTHTGVANDDVGSGMNDRDSITPGYEYRDFAIKSFAVRVEGSQDSSIATTVTLNKANIQSVIKEENGITKGGGGGLYVSGGTVTLGNKNSQQGDISITTQGTSYSGDYTVAGHENSNWHAPVPITGGHAVQVNGGSLTIYNGTYQSALGNGILVSNGTAAIQYGSFIGADPVKNNARIDVAGAAANYGFKMYGGTVTINGGTFGGNGSGAFVMGTSTDSGTNVAQANIYGGSFDVTGQAGFSVYQYANVTFGNDSNDIITAKGDAAGLVIETTPNGDAPTVTINAGTFESIRNSNGDGVWYGNGSAKLTITDGKFIGSSRAGLCIDDATQDSHKIVISGGTFNGSQAGLWYSKSASVNDGLLIMGGTFEGTDYGVYLAENPWSEVRDWWNTETYNNVAIVKGTFTGGRNAIGDASDTNQVKVGDVLTMHESYTVGTTTYYHYGYADGVNGNAGGGEGGAVNNIGTSVTLTMQPK